MKIVGVSGDRYLLVRDGVTKAQGDTKGRIYNEKHDELYPWWNFHSIMNHSHSWEEYDGDLTAEELTETATVLDSFDEMTL